MIYAAIGAGFGDEGKGKVVSSLCLQAKNPLVIRYSGGQQAGHRVVLPDGRSHISSNFSSGALQNIDTYWSKFCTMDPVGIMNELSFLKEKGANPFLYIDMNCPITTPFEKTYNINHNIKHQHGTCGVGVGQTYQREEDHFSLKTMDLLYRSVFLHKFDLLYKYYDSKHHPHPSAIEFFMEMCNKLVQSHNVILIDHPPMGNDYDDIIFEGSQGLLLDESIGFFPHVTRGHTGTHNILKMQLYPDAVIPADFEIFLVTRAYQTRHGNGPMTNETLSHEVPDNSHEHNSSDGMQGVFRTSVLDLDLLKYAIQSDEYIRTTKNKTLVITCLDVIKDNYRFTQDGIMHEFSNEHDFIYQICLILGFSKCYISKSPINAILVKVL